MKMHYGVPAVPTVKVGDYVRMGQCVGVPEKGSFSVPVHSGISGKVTDISDIRLPNGILTPAVTIKNDMKRARLDSVRPRSGFKLSATEAIGVIRDAGICGIAAYTEHLYLPNNMVRECFGIIRDLIAGKI